jgi:cyclopropane fatty-acyl-phospholipid synthase-like methyltransferase
MSFAGSETYWRERYVKGGNSGKGSYGRLAAFKAGVVNTLVALNGYESVIDFGSGDGAQLGLAAYPRYLGVDVSPEAVDLCRARFAKDSTKQFVLASEYDGTRADLALSMDVIYHLIEDEVFDAYMRRLFDAALDSVCIYASAFDRDQVSRALHVKHRDFRPWIEQNQPDFKLTATVLNAFKRASDGGETSPADFFIYHRKR